MAKSRTKKEVKALVKRGEKLMKQILKDPLVKELVSSERRLIKKTIHKAVTRARKKIKSSL